MRRDHLNHCLHQKYKEALVSSDEMMLLFDNMKSRVMTKWKTILCVNRHYVNIEACT